MLSESAKEKLSRYQYALMERDARMKKAIDTHEIILLYAPPLNMLACDFDDQVLEDENKSEEVIK